MEIYLKIVIFVSMVFFVGIYFYSFINYQKRLKNILLIIDFWVWLTYTVYLAYTFIQPDSQFLEQSKQIFIIMGWLLISVFFITEFKSDNSIGFFLTPLLSFIALLGVVVSEAPDLINLSDISNYEIAVRHFQWLVLFLGSVFYFYSIVISCVNYRIYLELKYHLPFFFNNRLPPVNQMEVYTSRYLMVGNAFTVFSLIFFWLTQSKITDPIWLQKLLLMILVFTYFMGVWLLRKKKVLTIKSNSVVMTVGAFLLILHFFYF